ncbi:MAG: ATP-dependent protease La [Myxococcales bacterium]|nr:ATP-dependent protease La [Myxococcales bacterium]
MTTEDAKTLPLLSLRNLVLFPGAVMPVEIGRPSSLRLIEALGGKGARVLVGTQKDADIEEPASSDLYTICVEGEVVRIVKAAENRVTAVLRGLERRRVSGYVQEKPYLVASYGPLTEIRKDPIEIDGLGMAVYDVAKQLVAISPDIPDETAQVFDQSKDPGRLGDIVAATVDLSPEERASLLVESDVAERLRRLLVLLQRKVELIKVKQKIDSQVREEFSKHQREAVLRQKLKAIQDELGEGEDASDLDLFDEKIKAADMPADVEKTARKQLDRLKQMAQSSAEYTVQRTYLEWLVELPWTKQTEDRLDLEKAREILDSDHYDLKKVKKRILEYLAVRKLAPGKKGPILCLAGPPGVGKTSLGKSIARSLGREFIRISLGGVRDEAEIRGHRRTYIGALPGRIIQGMRRVGYKNPVFMLDEIDKLGADFRGDPSAALLEVLDPEQNSTFSDHYLEVNFDLSNVIFIATANMLDPIPPALLDRMEVLEIPGYTREEKLQIARRHLVPKQVSDHGLTDAQIRLPDPALNTIIEQYTREAGVRNLEREIANTIRGVAVKVAESLPYEPELTPELVGEMLGPPKYYSEAAERTEIPGVATGLAWTPTGGDILFIEASAMPGKGSLILTGQLGDVMKESARAGMSWVRTHVEDLGITGDFEKTDIHLHVPAGGVSKDGPSAGVAITTALVSLLTGRRVRGDVAMTGEITLRGTVLPVGGIKEKVLAAHRAGIKHIVLPERNSKDIIDIPDTVRAELEIFFVKKIDEALEHTLEAIPLVVTDPDAPKPAATAQA